MGWKSSFSSYIVALEEGQVQVVGHVLRDGGLATCRGACEEDDVPRPLYCWPLTHCLIWFDLTATVSII